jgi:hypothetical protein
MRTRTFSTYRAVDKDCEGGSQTCRLILSCRNGSVLRSPAGEALGATMSSSSLEIIFQLYHPKLEKNKPSFADFLGLCKCLFTQPKN